MNGIANIVINSENAASVGCSILANLVYDSLKLIARKIGAQWKIIKVEEITTFITKKVGDKYEKLVCSADFINFLKESFFQDAISEYIEYVITLNEGANSCKIPKRNGMALEKETISFLVNHYINDYYEEHNPEAERKLVTQFFRDYFKLVVDYFYSATDEKGKAELFLLNRTLLLNKTDVMDKLNEIDDRIRRLLACEIVSDDVDYTECVEEYHKILKTKHSTAHIYLLDTFDFNKFYVPPILSCTSDNSKFKRVGNSLYPGGIGKLFYEEEENKDGWKNIFDVNNIIYITGGAGYGKTLFLKKLINDHEELDILNCSDYLVIYGDLKTYYEDGKNPISVVKYLQNSMIRETGLDEKIVSIELIEYYLKRGRCLILLDALDEVEKKKREEIHKRIIAYFKNKNPNNKICITSRSRGFIPDKSGAVYEIKPLDKNQIEEYLDNIIRLKKFNKIYRENFLEQSEYLVKKGFLSSFLVLSLLINIYKGERELPENKNELYKKCFDYITCKREPEKVGDKFDWKLISCMMKANTFSELAYMCCPNNKDIYKQDIVNMLCSTYKGKFASEVETERAAEDFLVFCSDRTELFVPSAGEDCFRFFHRSFYEYFYSQYVYSRVREVTKVYGSILDLDVDSEICELILAKMKQEDEPRYQELIEYIIAKAEEEIGNYKGRGRLHAFDIFTLSMQVVDDYEYAKKYVNYITQNSKVIINRLETIMGQSIIYDTIMKKEEFVNQVIEVYKPYIEITLFETYLEMISRMRNSYIFNRRLQSKEYTEESRIEKSVTYAFYVTSPLDNNVFLKVGAKQIGVLELMKDFSKDNLDELMKQCHFSKRTKDKILQMYIAYDKESEKYKETCMKAFVENCNEVLHRG